MQLTCKYEAQLKELEALRQEEYNVLLDQCLSIKKHLQDHNNIGIAFCLGSLIQYFKMQISNNEDEK